MPMAAVDDPGESFVAAGQEKPVKRLIPKTTSVNDQFQTGGIPGELEATDDQGSLASFDKDSNPSGQHLQVKSFGRFAQQPIAGGPGCWESQ